MLKKPEIKKGKWELEEDIKLVYFYYLEKKRSPDLISWSLISRNIANRTTDQCRVHFKVLQDNKSLGKIINELHYREYRKKLKRLADDIERELQNMPTIEQHLNLFM